jgi:hypothetical protein
MVGTARDKASVLSFVLDGYRTEEVGAALNQKGIAVRSGHHCAQPILRRFGLEATVRPSIVDRVLQHHRGNRPDGRRAAQAGRRPPHRPVDVESSAIWFLLVGGVGDRSPAHGHPARTD